MMKRRFLFFVAYSALFALSASLSMAQEKAASSAQPLDSPATPTAFGEKLHLEGIHNAGKANGILYRGGQPKNEGALVQLKKLGVTTVVDLRGESREKMEWEQKQAEALGLRFVHIPVSGWSPPSDEQVAQFLSLFRDDRAQKMYVHCLFGDDRTGVFVATYRMAVEKWSPEQAMKEMYFFGFNGFWHPAMKAYIRKFPEHVGSSPALASLRAQRAAP